MNTKGRAFSGLLRTALRQQLQYRSAMMAGRSDADRLGLIYTMGLSGVFSGRAGTGRIDADANRLLCLAFTGDLPHDAVVGAARH